MTTIAAGASGSYTFSSAQSVTVTLASNERALVEIRRAGDIIHSQRFGSTRTIGPFAAGDVMTLTADGAAIDYAVSNMTPAVMLSRPTTAVRVVGSGSSQYSRCMTESAISSADITDGVLNITTTASHAWMTGAMAFCTVPGMFLHGPITVVDNTHITMDASGRVNVAADTSGDFFLTMTGMYSGASWLGRLHHRYGAGMKLVAWCAKHGDDVDETALRLPELLRHEADICIYEPGWGNSLNQDTDGLLWDTWFPVAMDNLVQVINAYPVVIVPTLPATEQSGGAPTAGQIGLYNRLNAFIRTLPRLYANVRIVDLAAVTIDPVSTTGLCITGLHSDDLHWKPKGAQLVFNTFHPVLDEFIEPQSLLRNGASDVYANGGLQLFDGLLNDGTGLVLSSDGGTGFIDTTMVYSDAAAGTCTGSLVAGANGLYMQRLEYTGLAATYTGTVKVQGASGALIATRMIAGHTYRIVARIVSGAVTGTVDGITIVGIIVMTGVAGNVGERICWAGRSQQGSVEVGGTAFGQVDAETHNYTGADFTVPLGATVTAFDVRLILESGAATTSITIDMVDIAIRDVTDEITL